MAYRFHVHKTAPAWRLVLDDGKAPPADYDPAAWTFTRGREADDVNPDVRRLCDEAGYCLFKMGATFADLARDLGGA